MIVDGDMVAYRVAAAAEEGYEFGDGQFILSADAEEGIQALEAMLENFADHLDADRIIITLTAKDNYRNDVLPSYKQNRAGVRRPMILPAMREFLEQEYETFVRPRLEADDVMGILGTHPKIIKGDKVLVTWDKDLLSIPGYHWNPTHQDELPPIYMTEEAADLMFYAQILSGDAVDGYPGCPGIGVKRAERIVASPELLIRREREIQRGPNKGTMREYWETQETDDIWASIVSHYEKAGLTEADALQTAQVARILRHTDYDFKKKEPILWQPPKNT